MTAAGFVNAGEATPNSVPGTVDLNEPTAKGDADLEVDPKPTPVCV